MVLVRQLSQLSEEWARSVLLLRRAHSTERAPFTSMFPYGTRQTAEARGSCIRTQQFGTAQGLKNRSLIPVTDVLSTRPVRLIHVLSTRPVCPIY